MASTKSFAAPPTSDQKSPVPCQAAVPAGLFALVLIQVANVKLAAKSFLTVTTSSTPSQLSTWPRMASLANETPPFKVPPFVPVLSAALPSSSQALSVVGVDVDARSPISVGESARSYWRISSRRPARYRPSSTLPQK